MCPRLETRGAFALLFFPAFLRDACFAASSTAPSPLLGRCFSLFPAVRGRACVDGGALAARRCGIAVPKAAKRWQPAAGWSDHKQPPEQQLKSTGADINLIVMQLHAAPRRPVKLAHC
jgi:hypothetical protein